MDAFVTRNTKVGNSVPAAKKTANPPKRKYDDEYLALGFTVATVGTEDRPMRQLCRFVNPDRRYSVLQVCQK
ncbi:hypothetical protein KUCAC02_018389 [Chaenocephalus aceratus]|uniref:Uncharacterized protein n=1 Tax=Chaenocephalus aceratus TaxID=36190 RepID=A0ACB9W979_CHAAC|nr:hypothetical protein KUCAC02_018389 [Chaenocephalus aceratus]